ncbi:MAG: copper amine oxidase-like protein [Eubacterium sp.]|nr:copper amine oxidase-like protein [Eubacterium sp.]
MKKIVSIIMTAVITISCLRIPLNTINAAGGSVSVDNATVLPEKVKVNNISDFKKKLATAVSLKKSSIVIEVSKYNSKEYAEENIDKFFDDVNFEICFSKGYLAEYSVTWTTSGNSAKYNYRFTYTDISKSIRTESLKKVRNVAELNQVVKTAVQQKSSVISVALTNCQNVDYNLEMAIKQANDAEILSKGYYASYKGYDGLNLTDNKVVNIYLEYFDSQYNKPSTTKITSYEQFYTSISKLVKNKEWKFVFAIDNYNSEIYNLGEILLRLNKEILSHNGYCARISYRTVKGEAPAVMEAYLEYEDVKPGVYIPDKDKALPIFKNEMEWYQAIKKAITNFDKDINFNITYSSDSGDIISKVLDQNPDINYVKSYSTSSNGNINFKYKFADDQLPGIKKKVDEKASEIVSRIIKPDMNETQKAGAIHDYIIKNTIYDYGNFRKDTVPEAGYTAYGILINGTGVCQGYAGAFKLIAGMAGIKCIGISGEAGGPHAWIMARLDGKTGYIDVTWDDPVPDKGSIYYKYFNISETQLSKDHKWNKDDFCEKYLEF